MRILILLMLLVSAKITNAAPTEQTPNFILEPIQQTQQKKVMYKFFRRCACGGTGRRCRLKICWDLSRAGSSPA